MQFPDAAGRLLGPGQGHVAGGNGPQIRARPAAAGRRLLCLRAPGLCTGVHRPGSRRSCGFRSESAAAFLYLRGPALWPGVVIGDLLVNNYSELPVGSAIGQSFGNLLEVVIWRGIASAPDLPPTGPLWSIPGLAVDARCDHRRDPRSAPRLARLSLALGGVVGGDSFCAPVADVVGLATSAAALPSCLSLVLAWGASNRSGPLVSGSLRRAPRLLLAVLVGLGFHHDPRRASRSATSLSRR